VSASSVHGGARIGYPEWLIKNNICCYDTALQLQLLDDNEYYVKTSMNKTPYP
jgi:hypothetical protein